MENQIFRMKELKSSREKTVKKLTKVLNTLVNLEWELCAVASKTNDNISKLAIKSISESASSIQTAISQLISTEINYKKEKTIEEKKLKTKDENPKLQTLRKVVLNKKMNIADDSTAIIIGSGGGIGKALKQELFKENYYKKIICFSKTNDIQLDITDENAILKVTNELKRKNIKINLLINAVGYLHDEEFFS